MTAQVIDKNYRTLPAGETRVGDLIQACHGDPTWQAVTRVEFHPETATDGGDLYAIETEDADGVENRRFWGGATFVRIIR